MELYLQKCWYTVYGTLQAYIGYWYYAVWNATVYITNEHTVLMWPQNMVHTGETCSMFKDLPAFSSLIFSFISTITPCIHPDTAHLLIIGHTQSFSRPSLLPTIEINFKISDWWRPEGVRWWVCSVGGLLCRHCCRLISTRRLMVMLVEWKQTSAGRAINWTAEALLCFLQSRLLLLKCDTNY